MVGGMALKFYTSEKTIRLKVKVRIFLGLIFTLVEVTGQKLVGGPLPPTLILDRVKYDELVKGLILLI